MMKDKKNKNEFDVKKAKDYFSANEHSYQQSSRRLSERGLRSNLDSQLQSTYGKSAKKDNLSRMVSSKQSSGSEFGGAGQPSKTVKTYQEESKMKKEKKP